ncbi:MAG: porin [Caulobacterales bacterium]|nr:porin [Caulobacterales bacterium]
MSGRILGASAVAVLLCGAAPAALAQEATATAKPQPVTVSQEQLLALVGRLDALEKRNEELEGQIQDLKVQASGNVSAIRGQIASQPTVSLANGRPTISSPDGRFTASLRGIVQLDAAKYDQHDPGPLATDFRRGSLGDAGEADHARDLSDGTNFRRVRFGIEGKAWGDWSYNLLFDFGGAGVEDPGKINNAYIEYAGFNPVKLRVGAYAQTTSLEDATPNTSSLFLERPAAAELVRGLAGGDGRVGASAFASGERWSLAGTVTGNTIGVSSFDEQLGFIGRATFVPYRTADALIHVGANLNWVINPAATGPDVTAAGGAATPVRLRERPELRVDGTRLVDTGSLDADGVVAYGLELGGQVKQFTVSSEYFRINVDRRNSVLADPHFDGWYVAGAWTLTGQPRRYNTAAGGFDAPKIDKPFDLKTRALGVWELAARYSDLNLDYAPGSPGTPTLASAIRGGEQKIVTVGLNWYPNSNVRFLADYQHVDVDRLSPGGTAFGAGALTPPAGAQVGQTYSVWSLRTQYAF